VTADHLIPNRSDTLECLRIDRIRVESMLRMLEGNTNPADIKMLEREWLGTIVDRIGQLKQKTVPGLDGLNVRR
jgi:hypothetical protein